MQARRQSGFPARPARAASFPMFQPPASPPTPPTSPARLRPATCPRCGGAFDCGAALPAATPCACAGVGLTPAQRAELRGRYEGCLCLACLQAVARGEAAASAEDLR